MKKILLFLFISGISSVIFAQKHGYILKDSAYLSGFIYNQSVSRSASFCKYSYTTKGEIITYTPEQLRGYGYGKVDFVTMKIKKGNDSVRMFLQSIVPGKNPVYYLNAKSGRQFYILNAKNELVELLKKNGEYKNQLAAYFDAPSEIVPTIHTGFNLIGIVKTAKILNEANLSGYTYASDSMKLGQNELPVRKRKWLNLEKPVAVVSFQSGVAFQKLPLDLHAGLPLGWNNLKASSITYSLAIDIPIIKNWPVTYHQEICYNKFVTDYKQGSEPPDYQLIQNCSVISLPTMLRYTFGRKKFTGFLDAGVQFDIILNKNNVGWVALGSGEEVSGNVTIANSYLDYTNVQAGFTGGFGISYKLNKKLVLNSEFRYSRIFNVFPDMAGAENQSVLKVGVAYNFYKKGNNQ